MRNLKYKVTEFGIKRTINPRISRLSGNVRVTNSVKKNPGIFGFWGFQNL